MSSHGEVPVRISRCSCALRLFFHQSTGVVAPTMTKQLKMLRLVTSWDRSMWHTAAMRVFSELLRLFVTKMCSVIEHGPPPVEQSLRLHPTWECGFLLPCGAAAIANTSTALRIANAMRGSAYCDH